MRCAGCRACGFRPAHRGVWSLPLTRRSPALRAGHHLHVREAQLEERCPPKAKASSSNLDAHTTSWDRGQTAEPPACLAGNSRVSTGRSRHLRGYGSAEDHRKNVSRIPKGSLGRSVEVKSCFVAFPRKPESRVADAPIAVSRSRGLDAGTSKGSAFPDSDCQDHAGSSPATHAIYGVGPRRGPGM